MKKVIFILSFFISLGCASAQVGQVSGSITFENGKPGNYVNVFLENTNFGCTANSDGTFTINNIPYGSYKLVLKFIGFKTITKRIEIDNKESIILRFVMEESDLMLDEVVVSGTMKEMSKSDSPVPIEVYTAKYLENNKNPSIFESLQNVNGVRPQLNCNVCNTGDIHINGLEGPYTMVLIDGMPIVSGISTVYGLTGIPSSLIERVEIVKGPASALYGSEAVGGVVNVITKKPINVPLVSAYIYTTTWKETNTDLAVKYKLSKKVNALMGVNYFNYQNPIDNNGDNFTDVTLQDRISVFNKVSIEREDNRMFDLGMRYIYEDRWGGEMQWNPEYRGGDSIYGESIYTSRWELFGNYQLPISTEKINFQFSANSHQQNSVYGSDVYKADQRIAFGQLTWNKEIKSHDLLLGSAYRYTYYDDNTGATYRAESSGNNPSVIHLPGIFFQDQISLNEFNTLLLGIRMDYNSIHRRIFSPRLNYKWISKNNKTILRLSAGNGFRVANVFTEDHAALTGAREVVFLQEIRPEESINININAVQKWYTKKENYISLDATLFYTQFSNRIVPDYETNPNQIIYTNLNGNAVSKGVSLNFDQVYNSGWKLMGGFTFMDVTIEEEGQNVDQLLTENFSAVWSIEYLFKKLNLKVNYTGNVYGPMRLPLLGELDDRAEYSPWWSLQNIQLTKIINQKWEIYGGVKNILNFTPPSNSIARANDPFDKKVKFDSNGNALSTPNNPNALTFDPSYVYAPNQGVRGFIGFRYKLE